MAATLEEIRNHWSRPDSYDASWSQRAEAAVAMCEGLTSASDLGCGAPMVLRKYLPEGVAYVPCDQHAWTPDVVICDLGALRLPVGAILRTDVCFALGLIEYLPDVPGFFEKLGRYCRRLAFSYCSTDASAHRFNFWINNYSGGEIGSIAGLAGFRILRTQSQHPGQYIFYAENRRRLMRTRRKMAAVMAPSI